MNVSDPISHEALMRYLDGELPPEEHARVEALLATSTELAREVSIYRAMKGGFSELTFHPATHRTSVWDQVDRRLTRPLGWLLLIVGATVWFGYGAYVFALSPIDPWQKLSSAAVVIGTLVLLASVILERYRDWQHDPYRDIQR